MKSPVIVCVLFFQLFFWHINVIAGAFDFLANNNKVILSKNICKHRFNFKKSTPKELVCYSNSNTFFGLRVLESIIRFSPHGQAISGDFLLFASMKRSAEQQLKNIKNT